MVAGGGKMTLNQARTLVTGDKVKWESDGSIGKVRFDHKTNQSFVDWPDGQTTWTEDEAALKFMHVVELSKTVNGLPR
jgi:hypothetical protein